MFQFPGERVYSLYVFLYMFSCICIHYMYIFMLLYTNASSGVLRDIILLPISLPIDTLIQTVFYKGRVPSITSFFIFTFYTRRTNNIYTENIYFCIFCTLVSIHKSQLFLFMGHSKQLTVKLQGLCCP
jgi:hypothetical protein